MKINKSKKPAKESFDPETPVIRTDIKVNGKLYPIKPRSFLRGKLASYANELGLEHIMTVTMRSGDKFEIYDTGIGNLESGNKCAVKVEADAAKESSESNPSVKGKYGKVEYKPRKDGMSGTTPYYCGFYLFSAFNGKGKSFVYEPYWAGETKYGGKYNSIEDAVKYLDTVLDKNPNMAPKKKSATEAIGSVFDGKTEEYRGFTITPSIFNEIKYGDQTFEGFTVYMITKNGKYLPDELIQILIRDAGLTSINTIDDAKKVIDTLLADGGSGISVTESVKPKVKIKTKHSAKEAVKPKRNPEASQYLGNSGEDGRTWKTVQRSLKKSAGEAVSLGQVDGAVVGGGGPVSTTDFRRDFEEAAKRLKEIMKIGDTTTGDGKKVKADQVDIQPDGTPNPAKGETEKQKKAIKKANEDIDADIAWCYKVLQEDGPARSDAKSNYGRDWRKRVKEDLVALQKKKKAAKGATESTGNVEWKQVCQRYCDKIGAELLFVNDYDFGYELPNGQMVHKYADELAEEFKPKGVTESAKSATEWEDNNLSSEEREIDQLCRKLDAVEYYAFDNFNPEMLKNLGLNAVLAAISESFKKICTYLEEKHPGSPVIENWDLKNA